MKDLDLNDLIARAARGSLSKHEEDALNAQLRLDPSLATKIEEEKGLDVLLQHLPDAPVASNFTSLAVQAALRQGQTERPSANIITGAAAWLRGRAARVGLATAAIALISFSALHHVKTQRGGLARSVRSFTEVASVIGGGKTPPEQLFQDFDTIQKLSLPEHSDVDLELLVALQK
jgi:hypothetical protein